MSVTVALDALRARVDEFGATAYLITVGEHGRPHVVSVRVEWDRGRLLAGAGRTTAANVDREHAVSMLWPPRGDGDYALIVDGAATVEARAETAVAVIDPSRAVLHRVADAAGDGPSCVTVL